MKYLLCVTFCAGSDDKEDIDRGVVCAIIKQASNI